RPHSGRRAWERCGTDLTQELRDDGQTDSEARVGVRAAEVAERPLEELVGLLVIASALKRLAHLPFELRPLQRLPARAEDAQAFLVGAPVVDERLAVGRHRTGAVACRKDVVESALPVL